MTRPRYSLTLLVTAIGMAGCQMAGPDAACWDQTTTMQAQRLAADQSVTLDGRLDEAAWGAAPIYSMDLAQEELDEGKSLQEGATVRLLWDDEHLYVGVEMVDSDVVQEDDRDQQHHYRSGDLVEVFIKPEGARHADGRPAHHYWEYYATPQQRKTAMFFPSRGHLALPSTLKYTTRLQVAATVDGTLNDWQDRDRGWTAEVAVSRAELAEAGVELNPHAPWRILVSRYNYSAHLTEKELSMAPSLPEVSYHDFEFWARLVLGE